MLIPLCSFVCSVHSTVNAEWSEVSQESRNDPRGPSRRACSVVMNGRVLTLTLIILVIHVQHFDLKKHRHNDRVRHCGRQCQHSIVKRVEHRMEKTVNRTIRKIRKEYEAYQKKYESLLHAMRKELECLSHLCPTGFIRYKKFCFRFVMHSKKTWRDAQKYCQDAGANLIFLNSTKKQEFVAKHLKDNFADDSTQDYHHYIMPGHGS
ncbi:C-type lectin domain family 10 member A-like isoform X2 [Haliotis asinina]|uniref:C-type lectin domain family 10 member A-like isoform X2 n=1 Tax=Haliotis asinina TaxID=109174 RepID=UPI003531C329